MAFEGNSVDDGWGSGILMGKDVLHQVELEGIGRPKGGKFRWQEVGRGGENVGLQCV